MTHRELDLADIQGNIVRPYGRFGFPVTRHLFFNIADAAAGRRFVEQVRHAVTTSVRWGAIDGDSDADAAPRPDVCLNIGFTFWGLYALALPTRTLSRFPEEFIDGMAKRWSILGDIGPSAPDAWDPIWRDSPDVPHRAVHVCVSLNAQAGADGKPAPALAERTAWLIAAAERAGGVSLLEGHKGPDRGFQDSSAIMAPGPDGAMLPTAKEHFGFTDGISDPAFAGQYEPANEAAEVVGGGKIRPGGKGWGPIATGEFILGHASEAQEHPPTAQPWSLTRNGTFMVYRKLHQNVASFRRYVARQGEMLQALGGADRPAAAEETVMAKMVGRWRSGIPLAAAPTYAQAEALAASWSDIPGLQAKGGHNRTDAENQRLADYETLLTDFRYADDLAGARCPVAAHVRRANPRDALDPLAGTKGAVTDSALTNRRRVLRRGAPYGEAGAQDDAGEHGVIFMALCSSLFRQFEFVQQQWIQYGASFNVGNDTDPLCGLRRPGAKFVVPGDAQKGTAPFICTDLPQFVETRGGDYFFIPSLTALREIAEGSVDPT